MWRRKQIRKDRLLIFSFSRAHRSADGRQMGLWTVCSCNRLLRRKSNGIPEFWNKKIQSSLVSSGGQLLTMGTGRLQPRDLAWVGAKSKRLNEWEETPGSLQLACTIPFYKWYNWLQVWNVSRLLHITLSWRDKRNVPFSSTIIPRDLTEETCSIGPLSYESWSGSDKVLSFCLEPNNINSVLVSLLELSHFWFD